MNLPSKSVCALLLAAAFFSSEANQASALPMPSLAVGSPALVTPVACKYGSGKCANVKPVHQAPSTGKNGPQDPTVDPDCKAYGNCHDGPNGGPAGGAAAKKGGTGKPKPVVASGIKGESMDDKHKGAIEVDMRKSGHDAPDLAKPKPVGQLKTH
jgi:hypothetical protein